jgi:lysyl-tRNA synthetase class 2
MLITGAQAIREVILFPTMRPEGGIGARASKAGLASESVPSAAAIAAASELARIGGEDGGEAADGGEGTEDGAAEAAADEDEPKVQATARSAEPAQPPPTPTPGRPPRLLAWLTALGGLVYLLPLLPQLHDRLGLIQDNLIPRDERIAGHVTSVLIGLGLTLAAPQLARRKRRAWQVAVALFAAGVVVHALKGPHPVAVLYGVAMLVALVARRDAFEARGDPASLLGVARFVPAYALFVFVFGYGSLWLERAPVSRTCPHNSGHLIVLRLFRTGCKP